MQEQGNTDVAALAASTMAVAISMTLAEGAWSSINAIVGLSIVLLLIGYSWRHKRSRSEQFGYAAALALAGLPIIAFALELWELRGLCPYPSQRILFIVPYMEPSLCLEHMARRTSDPDRFANGSVSTASLMNSFIAVAVISYALDSYNQRRHHRDRADSPD